MNLEDFARGSVMLWPLCHTPLTVGGPAALAHADNARANKGMRRKRVDFMRSNENKMSDGERKPASLGVNGTDCQAVT